MTLGTLWATLLSLFTTAQGPLVVLNDPGGIVSSRAEHIAELGDRLVMIEGYCASACTMYLGASNVCVFPEAILMFHGPSFFGLPLPETDFEYWSRFIASYYPDVLAQWYLYEGRYGEFWVTGQNIIELGVPECLVDHPSSLD